MKRFVYYIALLPLVTLCACSHDDIDDVVGPVGNGKITIAASLDDMVITRAADTQAERTVEHIDVFAVDVDGNIDYYERNSTGNNSGDLEDGAGKLTLSAARRAKNGENYIFAEGANYKFYLVANSTASEDEMDALATLHDLELLLQDDIYTTTVNGEEVKKTKLHLTGTNVGDENNRPTSFLMDAVATDGNGNSEWVVNPASGNLSNLELEAEFKRAAAKIIVNITQGEDVEFRVSMEGGVALYDFYKLPCTTFVMPNDQEVVGINLIDTDALNVNDETFVWQYTDASDDNPRDNNKITVTGYAYAHEWGNENLTNETSLILNIPMIWNEDNSEDKSKESKAPNSWYKVPLSKNKLFERNKCYVVNITINAVGAENRSSAIELRDIEYKTLEWQSVGIDVGDSSDDPEYLVLNTDLVEMYNVNFDNSTLSFSSSSPITSVELKDVYSQNTDGTFTSAADNYYAYYINKFGVKTNLSNTIRNTISATAEQGVLNGGINIISLIRQSSASEVTLALEALGEEPVVPTEPDAEGKPNPEDYLPNGSSSSNTGWENIDGWKQITTTTTTSYSFEGNACYKTTTTDKTYSDWGTTYHVEGYPNTSKEEYSDNNTTQYFALLNEWSASHPEYQEYLDAKAKYDAYQTTKTAIENSDDSGVEETHYNTIRYLEFEVTNQQGLKATFRVMQYPTVYITNIQGWYSYRDDFGGTTLESRGDRTTSNTYFHSKVAEEITSGTNRGLSTIYRYYWRSGSNTVDDRYSTTYAAGNARMYHVKITATSAEYTLGKPRMDANGYTESSAENNKLVSPSFMLASQLGALSDTFSEIGPVRTHCQQYVEVYKDNNGNKVVLDDWRLPTRAELEIIIKYQYSSDAMDEVIRRQGYWCADGGQVTNPDGASGNGYLRCIRDAY
ncbi:MAG: DUF1566 domain-containing protein [Rikenellaceae bacterium]|nr:DUF1566 domain-containing protein [Rikenellaceae bacterium]